jgi:tetratricopeptide (TPR) repeat protein
MPAPALILSLALLLLGGRLRADSRASDFEQANLLYEQGQYEEAAAAYQAILERGRTSAALHFNLGNARFRQGQLGQAIAHFRLAQRLDPRDPDVIANLRFARQQATGTGSVQPGRLGRRLQWLSLDEWTFLSTASVWCLFGLLALARFRAPLQARLRPWLVVTAAVSLLLIATTFLAWNTVRNQATAIAVQPEVQVRYGPLEESRVHFTVRDGTELSAGDRLEDWVQVTDAARRTGWARRSDLVLLP